MKQQLEIRLLARFVGAEYEAYSIAQLARSTGAGYAHTHTTITGLLESGVLSSSTIGRMKFCTPNLENDETRALLALANTERKRAALTSANLRNLDRELRAQQAAFPSIIATILLGERIIHLVPDHTNDAAILGATSILNIAFRTPTEYRKELLAEQRREAIVLQGYERTLLLMLPIKDQLFLNHSQLLRKGVRR